MIWKDNWTVKKALITIAAVLIVSCGIVYTSALSADVTVTWSYDFGPEPACSPQRTNTCIDHFEVQDITDQQKMVPIKTVMAPEAASGKVDHISTTFTYGPPFGQRTISVIAVGRDPKGNRVNSNPFAARATVSIRPNAKVALSFTKPNGQQEK